MIELIIVIVYFLVVVGIGIASRRRHWGLDDFLVSGRRCSSLFITGSLLATIIGGSATIGMAGLGFSRGLTGAWWLLVGTVGLIFLGLLLARKVRESRAYTLPGLLGKQYDNRVSLASSIFIIIAWLGVIAGQIIAAGKILSILGIGSPELWMAIFTAAFLAYVIIGGQVATIRTDVLQIAVIVIGIFAGLIVLLGRVGGLNGLISALPPSQSSFPLSQNFGSLDLLSYLLIIGLTYVVGPDIYTRLFCARDEKTARKSAFLTALCVIPIAFAITIIGMGASVLYPTAMAEQAFPAVIRGIFPPIIGGLVLAALVSAVFPSALVMSAGTILTVDIVGRFKKLDDKQTLFTSRSSILLLGVLSLLLALVLKGIISALLFAYTIYTCGVILPAIAGFYKDKLKVTSSAALTAIIGGGMAGLLSKVFVVKYLDLGGLAISLFLLIVVSVLDNKFRKKIAPATTRE